MARPSPRPVVRPKLPRDELREALAAADLRVLLMCLFHLTGDEKWLSHPYTPARDTALIPDPEAGIPEPLGQEIRSAAQVLLLDGVPEPVVTCPSFETFGRMMSHCLGEGVPPEYIPMMYEDFGFADRERSCPQSSDPRHDVAIVGAGASGICLAAKLRELGVPFTVFERNAEVGGTWFENRYPGCGVDTPNHFYSYSFRPNPGWNYYFSPREELQEYLERCASELGIRDQIQLNTTVRSAHWSDTDRRWHITISANGNESDVTARVLVSATGHFSRPRDLDIPGIEEFRGDVFHTAQWPEDSDLVDRRVGVIGTGASAMQVVPSIVEEVEALDIFQRTPQWIRPVGKYNLPVHPAARWLFESLPFYGRWYRFSEFWRFGDGLLSFLRRDPDWPHPRRSVNKGNDRHRTELLDYLERQLDGRSDLIEKCTPSYPPFAKRMLIDNGWFDALRQQHVDLVTDPIERIEPDGIRLASGSVRSLDVIVLATGFAIINLAEQIDIRGRGGKRLADDWTDEDPTAHLGMTIPSFPNFFVMFGPNTNMGHGGSGMWLAETQSRYITGCLALMSEHDASALEVREDVRVAYTRRIDELHEGLIWAHPGVQTYYRNPQAKVRSPMPFRLVDYWHLTRDPDLEDFVITRTETQSSHVAAEVSR